MLKTQSMLTRTMVALAVCEVRNETGKLPASLQEVAGKFSGGKVPLDPANGQAFRYEPREDGSYAVASETGEPVPGHELREKAVEFPAPLKP